MRSLLSEEVAVADPVAEVLCAMIDNAINQYRKFADLGYVEGFEMRMEKWPRHMARLAGNGSKSGVMRSVTSLVFVERSWWSPTEVKESVLEFLAPGGGMDRLIELAGLRLDGDAIRRGLHLRPAQLHRGFTGVKRAEKVRTVGVLGHADAQVAMGRMVAA